MIGRRILNECEGCNSHRWLKIFVTADLAAEEVQISTSHSYKWGVLKLRSELIADGVEGMG